LVAMRTVTGSISTAICLALCGCRLPDLRRPRCTGATTIKAGWRRSAVTDRYQARALGVPSLGNSGMAETMPARQRYPGILEWLGSGGIHACPHPFLPDWLPAGQAAGARPSQI